MTEEEVKRIIRREFENFSLLDRYTFQKDIQIFDKINIELATTTGTKIGTSALQKIGFFNAAPVVRRTFVSRPTGGVVQDAGAREAIDFTLDRLEELGLFASS
jgi:hypothetical protein